MKIVRYLNDEGKAQFGAQHEGGSVTRIEGCIFSDHHDTGEAASVRKLLAPVKPAAVLCIGLNYRKHAEEGGADIPENPVLFMKMPSTVQNPGDPILLPTKLKSEAVDYECELAVVIGKDCKNVSKANALDYVLGYTCANDVGARDWQKNGGGGQWCRGKTFDTFCPLGPALVTRDEIPNPNRAWHQDRVERRSDAGLEHRRHDLRRAHMIEFLSGSTGTGRRDGDPHRHPARRRLRPHSPGAPEGWRRDHHRDRGNRRTHQSGQGRIGVSDESGYRHECFGCRFTRSRNGASFALINELPSARIQPCLSVGLYCEWQSVMCRAENIPAGLTTDDVLGYLRYIASQSHLQDINFLWRPFLKVR